MLSLNVNSFGLEDIRDENRDGAKNLDSQTEVEGVHLKHVFVQMFNYGVYDLSDADVVLMSMCHRLCQVRAEICSKEEVEEEEMEAAVSSAKKFVIMDSIKSPFENMCTLLVHLPNILTEKCSLLQGFLMEMLCTWSGEPENAGS